MRILLLTIVLTAVPAWSRPLVPVTSSADPGPGTLRAANATCAAIGSCELDFRLPAGATIELAGNLIWTASNALIDCSRGASGQGFQITGWGVYVAAPSNVEVINCRFRRSEGANRDCLAVTAGSGHRLHHNSMAWCTDGALDAGDGSSAIHDLTIEYNLLAETPKVMLIAAGTDQVTVRRNLFVSNGSRQPSLAATKVIGGITAQHHHVLENVVYGGIYGFEARSHARAVDIFANVIGNLYKRGPAPSVKLPVMSKMLDPNGGNVYVFVASNQLRDGPPGREWSALYPLSGDDGLDAATIEEWNQPDTWPRETCKKKPCRQRMAVPFAGPLPTETGDAVYDDVLARAGATLPCRDALDRRFVNDVRNGTGPAMPPPQGTLPDLTGSCQRE